MNCNTSPLVFRYQSWVVILLAMFFAQTVFAHTINYELAKLSNTDAALTYLQLVPHPPNSL
jgi:hypothetical protein